MSKMEAHDVKLEKGDYDTSDMLRRIADGDIHLATVAPADPAICRMVMRADPNSKVAANTFG